MKAKDYSPRRNKTVFALICALTYLISILCSCNAISIPSYPFSAIAEGTIDGKAVSVRLLCDPTEHKTKEIYNKLTVTFSSPEYLNGMTVSLRSDGKATVRLKDMEEESPIYEKIAEPFLAFLSYGNFSSIKRTENAYEATVENENGKISYRFDEEGRIISLEGSFMGHDLSFIIKNHVKL